MRRINRNYLLRGYSYLKRNGVGQSIYKAVERLSRDNDEKDYDAFMKSSKPSEEELMAQRKHIFRNKSKISILIPLYETEPLLLRQTLDSVANQTYGNWELCIADASKDDSRRHLVKQFCEESYIKCSDSFGTVYDKVKYEYLNANEGISRNTNKALAMATGEYIGLLDHDDLLEETALYDFMTLVDERELDYDRPDKDSTRIIMCYTDEDKITGDTYFDYHEKPDFDPVLLMSNNYICHFLIVDTNRARSVGGFRHEYDGAQDHDFILRVSEDINRRQIVHIPKVLYHWRSTSTSTAENPNAKLYAYDSGKRAVRDYLRRRGIPATVVDTPHLGFYKVTYDKQAGNVLTTSFEEFSKMDLSSIEQDYIMLLADKLRPVHKNYLDGLMACMRLDYVGAVTGKIIRKGRIESAGYKYDKNGSLKPKFSGMNRHFSGKMHRATTQQLIDGFSKDCVLIRKSAIKEYSKEIVLFKGYDIYYEPSEEFKR